MLHGNGEHHVIDRKQEAWVAIEKAFSAAHPLEDPKEYYTTEEMLGISQKKASVLFMLMFTMKYFKGLGHTFLLCG